MTSEHTFRAASPADEAGISEIVKSLAAVTDDVYPIAVEVNPRFPVHTTLGTTEVFPDTMTPAAWSSTGEGLSRMARRIGVEMGILPKNLQIAFQGMFYGFAASNISAYYYFNRRLPGAPWWPYGRVARALIQAHADPIMGWEPPSNFLAWLADVRWRLRGLKRMQRLEASILEQVGPLEEQLKRGEDADRNRDYQHLDMTALIAEIKKPSLNAALVHLHMATTFFIGSHYMKLVTALARHTHLPPVRTANALLQNLGDVESTKPAQALKALAERARGVPQLATLLRERRLGEFAAQMASPAGADARAIAEGRADFLRRYGYRGIGEASFDAVTWAEDPGQADSLLALYIDDAPQSRPAKPANSGRLLTEEILGPLGSRHAREKMALYIANAQRFAAMRERTKSLTVRQSLRQRRLLRVLIERMISEGVLESAGDREMLSFKELLAAPAMDRAELRALVARRRKAFELLGKLALAEQTFRGVPAVRLAGSTVPGVDESSSQFAGLGLSPGVIEGVACVVRDPRLGVNLKAGEILVAPYTDAAWSPLFLLASGIVIDSATMISHGATVARELGLPAVANVPGTRAIRSGDRIRIDADAGTVAILERAPRITESRRESEAAVAGVQPPLVQPLAYSPEQLAVLRALRLKGRPTLELLAVVTQLPEDRVRQELDHAVAAGVVELKGRSWRLRPEGVDLQAEWLSAVRPDPTSAGAVYERFLKLNSTFKEAAFNWQMRDASTVNDHSDAAYDAAVLCRVSAIHADMRPILHEAIRLAPRLAPYAPRFDAAWARVQGGERNYLMSPAIDSYHSVWFEFHEELIELSGRTRVQEAAAGRAE